MSNPLGTSFFYTMDSKINQTLDHLFRHEYGRLISGLTSNFGANHIELIEDSVQDSLMKAAQLWAFNGIPDKPTSWLFKVSKNKLLDLIKRDSKSETLGFDMAEEKEEDPFVLDSEIRDEQLKMIFACCNPAIQDRDAVLLSLKLISGFSIAEISRALLIKEEAAKKSIQRAKNKFREEVEVLYVPSGSELKYYLHRVLKVIYLMFNEGYKTSSGKELVNRDLCGEALRLALLLIDKKECKDVATCSLISLMSFKIARFDARVDGGKLVTLKNQNRKLWIGEYIDWGNYYYHQATLFRQMDDLYLEASIEYQYYIAPSYEKIDWKKIKDVYKLIISNYNSPAAELNSLIVLAKIEEAKNVLKQLNSISKFHQQNHLFFAFRSELELEIGEKGKGINSLKQAIELSTNQVEKEYLSEKLNLIP